MSDTLRLLLGRMLFVAIQPPERHEQAQRHWREMPQGFQDEYASRADRLLATPEGKALAALVEAAVARRRADLAVHSIPAYEHDPVWVGHIKAVWAASAAEDAAVDALLALTKEEP